MGDPDVLFVVLDSLRRDRVSAYGHERETTPAFDRLATSGTLYEHAYTPAPWTLPSHCSMFTGRFPTEHGITNGFADRSLQLPPAIPTVIEKLAQRGYRTAGFSNNPWVGQLSGLDRGFDTFVEWDLEISGGKDAEIHQSRDHAYSRFHTWLGLAARQPFALVKRRFFTKALVDRATRWLGHSDGPTFTFLNLMEAHSPYYPPTEAFQALGLPGPGPVEARTINTKLIPYTAGKTTIDAAARDRILEYYDASARFQDGQLASLLETLARQGQLGETLIVVCADHGKTLGEFDRAGDPPHYLRNVNTKVPLVVKYPEQSSGERIADPVELTDLFELFVNGRPLEGPPGAGVALIEDSIPHTGRSAQRVTRWRAVADGDQKYLLSQGDEEYFLRGSGVAESVVRDDGVIPELQEAMDERIRALGDPTGSTEEPDTPLGRGVEAQLEDLGYL